MDVLHGDLETVQHALLSKQQNTPFMRVKSRRVEGWTADETCRAHHAHDITERDLTMYLTGRHEDEDDSEESESEDRAMIDFV